MSESDGSKTSRISINSLCSPSPELSPSEVEAIQSLSSLSSSGQFFSRVSTIPIVNSALRAYESTKEMHGIVRYSAEMMETVGKKVSVPVINKLGGAEQVDQFVCTYLDKWGVGNNPEQNSLPGSLIASSNGCNLRHHHRHHHHHHHRHHHYTQEQSQSHCHKSDESGDVSKGAEETSRWRKTLVSVGSVTGALSQEGMRNLKLCLEWLTFAVRHLECQIQLLRHVLSTLTQSASNTAEVMLLRPAQQTGDLLRQIRREVVDTLRKVVHVIGKYAGACLPPGEARNAVRSFLLGLPGRWAHLSSDLVAQSSANSSAACSPMLGPETPHSGHFGIPQALGEEEQANRILALATESLLTMQSVAGIFEETVQGAEGLAPWKKKQQQQPINLESSPDSNTCDTMDES